MLPNSHPSLDVRLAQLLEAIKSVYASTYYQQSRMYLESTPYRVEEEVMAVLIQRLVGARRNHRFYPTFSGVAASYNFYPFGNMRPADGFAQVALGLGKSVVDGFEALRFSPAHPQVLPQFSSTRDVLRNAQRKFYALDMSRDDVIPGVPPDANLLHLDIVEAVRDGAAAPIASTYRRADDRISGGLVDGEAPLITFAPLLKGRTLPLPGILTKLLDTCEKGIASPVEIEFAADIRPGVAVPQRFEILQLRPMVVEEMNVEVHLDSKDIDSAVVRSDVALGHGRKETISDLVVIDPARIERSMTREAALAIEKINRGLHDEGRHCILIGPGRWGSRDPWLGIPVAWPQISSARAIVETDFKDLEIDPSFGSHFFHNLTCFGVAFFSVHGSGDQGWINWHWLRTRVAVQSAMNGAIMHIRLGQLAQVVVDGATGRGVILEGASDLRAATDGPGQ